MVVIFLPAAALTGKEHERTASPSMCTVQAPHCAMPQPYLVPVSPTCSRNAQRSGVSASTSTSRAVPLILRRAILGLPHQVDASPRRLRPAALLFRYSNFKL